MKVLSFKIQRFKSIEEITIPLKTYGQGKQQSSVAFLVGLNESGKSSILEAISLWSQGLDDIDFNEYYYKEGPDEGNIRIEANLELEYIEHYQNKIVEILKIQESHARKIKFLSAKNITWKSEKTNNNYYLLKISSDFPFHEYVYSKTSGIQEIKVVNNVTEKIKSSNAQSFLTSGQVLLTQQDFEAEIALKLYGVFNEDLPEVNLWKPTPEYLINEEIDLQAFKDDTDISIPLRNIFHVSGLNENQKIKKAVEKALKRSEYKAELQANLSKSITNYINKIWKEHKINIKINIDGTKCSVHVEDKDKEYKFFSMNQRSDGFNQFVSLILSLSTQNDNEELVDTIILLDEPEIHLHPSGVRYMRDEILKIGKNNFLFVSTHSHYMVDTMTPERHFIVSKAQMKTHVNQVSHDASMNDDQVLASAFGISLFKELLPQNILVVEGGDDKSIISHALNLIFSEFFYSLKSAGGASKVYGISAILADERVPAYFLLDDDKEGRDAKRNILSSFRQVYKKEHVMTIKDISSTIPDFSTLEDLLPSKFVEKFFEQELNQVFSIDNKLPIINQLKAQNDSSKNNKEQLASLKIKLSNHFINSYNTKAKIESDSPELVNLLKELVKKIKR